MDLNEQLSTLLEANDYLVNLFRESGSINENPLAEDIKTLTDMVINFAKTAKIVIPALNLSAYYSALEQNLSPNPLDIWVYNATRLLLRFPKTPVDASFVKFELLIKESSEELLRETMKRNFYDWFGTIPEIDKLDFLHFHKYFAFWGSFDPGAGDFTLVNQRSHCLKHHIDDISAMYHAMSDYRSRLTLLGLLEYWLDFDIAKYNRFQERHFDSYYDLDLISCNQDEVFVDAGAYDGSTVLSYIANFGKENYRRIYCYDINRNNIELIKRNLRGLRNVDIRLKGLAEKNGDLYVNDDIPNESTKLQTTGGNMVPVVALDDDIAESITFLKIDIEGGEYQALQGAKKHIAQGRPKMALSVYHNNDDLWRIFKYVNELCDNYSYYFRFNARGANEPNPFTFAADYILLCIPNESTGDELNRLESNADIQTAIPEPPDNKKSFIKKDFISQDDSFTAGIPVYIPTFNNPTFTRMMVSQLKEWNIGNITIIDNKSTFPEMLTLLDIYEHEIKVIRLDKNYGPRHLFNRVFLELLPEIFCVTDPDLQFNKEMPGNFLHTLYDLTCKYQIGKAGLALDISDSELMNTEKYLIGDNYYHIWDWESQFWTQLIDYTTDDNPVYNAIVDTTFALYNKKYYKYDNFFNAVRVGGNLTCRHLPWYRDFKLPLSETEFYKKAQEHSTYHINK